MGLPLACRLTCLLLGLCQGFPFLDFADGLGGGASTTPDRDVCARVRRDGVPGTTSLSPAFLSDCQLTRVARRHST